MKQTYFFIKKIINKINKFLNHYQIPRYSASISFYMLISIISIMLLAIQIVTISDIGLNTFLIPKVLEIFSENFSDILIDIMPTFSFSGLSIIILFNFFWGASKTISGFDRIADFIYLKVKKRNSIWNRISSFLMFLMLLFVILFELALILLSNYFIIDVLKINYNFLIKFIQFIIELFVLFSTILILYLYSPPIKMKIKYAVKGAVLASLLIYLLLGLFVIIINLMNNFGIGYTIITILSLSLTVLYYTNFIIICCMVVNFNVVKNNGNNFQVRFDRNE